MYSVRPCQENHCKGHRSAAHGPHLACLHSCILGSTQHDKNQEISKLSFFQNSPNLASITSRQSWLDWKATTPCLTLSTLPSLSPSAFESLTFALWKWTVMTQGEQWLPCCLGEVVPTKGEGCFHEDLFI